MKWQTIKTAPKDGTRILCYGEIDGGIVGAFQCWWDQSTEAWLVTSIKPFPYDQPDVFYCVYLEPIYWMPVPVPSTMFASDTTDYVWS